MTWFLPVEGNGEMVVLYHVYAGILKSFLHLFRDRMRSPTLVLVNCPHTIFISTLISRRICIV